MQFTKEVLDGLKEEFKNDNLPLNLLCMFFVKAKVMLSQSTGLVDECYYDNVRQLINVYNMGKENYIPTKDDVFEERNIYFS